MNEPQNPPWTPGPWVVPGANVFRVVSSHAQHQNKRSGMAPPYPWAIVADMAPESVGGEQAAANARLIAAAPELAAALEALRGQVQFVMERGLVELLGMDILREPLDGTDALLARVRGEEN